MTFGYRFLDLTDDQKHARRLLLDHYAFLTQKCTLVLLGCVASKVLFTRLSNARKRAQTSISHDSPRSPYVKTPRDGRRTGEIARVLWNMARWQAGTAVREGWGSYGEWISTSAWIIVMLFLCMNETGEDFLHFTKRFGIVAASLLPFHYLLAMKSPYSPIQLLTQHSHEQLNAIHQILGRIILAFFLLHASFYLTYFIGSGTLSKRIWDWDVILGLASIISLSLLGTAALAVVRQWNYRLFYVVHITVATTILPLLFLHVHHIRLFIWETLPILALAQLLRYLNTHTYRGTVTLLPDTNLVTVRISLASTAHERHWSPGQHVLLHLPSDPSTSRQRLHTNPFSIASVPRADGHLLLVARVRSGHTLRLAALAGRRPSSSSSGANGSAASHAAPSPTLPLVLEGPYGAALRLPDLVSPSSRFDAVLLVAGGVGATFALPIYRGIIAAGRPAGRVRFVWAVRSLADTRWGEEMLANVEERPEKEEEGGGKGAAAADGDGEESVDASMPEVFVTRARRAASLSISVAEAGEEGFESIEMTEREQLMSGDKAGKEVPRGVSVRYGRPDVSEVVDDVFEGCRGEVAVLVCGPDGMVRATREAVGKWVAVGRNVFWHAESFGY